MRLEVTDTRTVTDENPMVRDLEFRKPPVSVGSHSENLVQLPDIDIAPHYATLDIVGGQWTFRPLVRDGLAKRNGEHIVEPVELHDGDVIEVTYFSIKFQFDPEFEVEIPDSAQMGDLAKIRQFPLPPRSEVRKPDADISLNAARQKALADFAMWLRDCTDLSKTLESTVRFLRGEFAARLAWMGVRREPHGALEFMDGLSDSGASTVQPPKFETYEYRCLSRQQFITVPRTGDEETQSVLAAPLMTSRGAAGLFYIDSRKHTRVYDGADLDFLTAVAKLLAPHFEGLFTRGGPPTIESSVGGGLAMLRQVQTGLDPKIVPDWPGLQITAYTKSGSLRGGDVYDIMRLPNGLGAVLVAHVHAGKGQSGHAPTLARCAAAIAQIQGAFRVAGLHADPPRTQLKALNWLLYEETECCRADAAVMLINPKTGAAELATAGDLQVIHVSRDGQGRSLTNSDSPAIATNKNAEYGGGGIRLSAGETLAFVTAGCVLARNQAGQELGGQKLMESVCDGFNRPARAAMDELLQDLAPFFKDGELEDDITLLLIHRPE